MIKAIHCTFNSLVGKIYIFLQIYKRTYPNTFFKYIERTNILAKLLALIYLNNFKLFWRKNQYQYKFFSLLKKKLFSIRVICQFSDMLSQNISLPIFSQNVEINVVLDDDNFSEISSASVSRADPSSDLHDLNELNAIQ